jgi:hypothetical protein
VAESTLIIQFKWENDNYFTMSSKLNAEDIIDIVKLEENAILNKLWPDTKSMIMKYVEHEVDIIGNEMKA